MAPLVPEISVLVAARKDSKYLAKFLFSFFENTFSPNVELLVMLNKHDTWNKELVSYFSEETDIQFFYEDMGLGRQGLHLYFNELYKHATGDWILYCCDDHQFIYPGWDNKAVIKKIVGLNLDPDEPWCLIPKFDNVGAMNQILSRGYIEAIGGMGQHGNIDSYINDVNRALGPKLDRQVVIRFDEELLHDFTHDKPSPMEQKSTPPRNPNAIPKYTDTITQTRIDRDAAKLRKVLNELQD